MKYVKFAQIFDFQKKSHIKAGDGLGKGKYPFFTSSQSLSKYFDSFQYDVPSLVFGTGGNANIHLTEKPFSTSTDCVVAQLKNSMVNNFKTKFVYYYLHGNMRILEKGFKGAGLKHISKDYINNIDIPELTIEKQEKSIKILDKSNSLVQKRKQSIGLLDDYLKSIFVEMFGDLNINSKKWKYISFGNCIEDLYDYHANGSYEVLKKNVTLLSKPDFSLMVRTTDLENNNFIDNVKYVDEHAYNFLNKSKIYGNEIIMNKIGSAGKVYLMPNLNRHVSLGMNAFLLRFKSDVNVKFIYYLLTSHYGETIIKNKVKGAVTKTIRKDSVRDLQIPNISLALQNKFALIVKKSESLKQKMVMQSIELENQFQALMQKTFSAVN